VADVDDIVGEKFLNDDIASITEDEIHAALRKGTIAFKLVPVLCGSAFKNKGVQQLLDAVVTYLPAPADIPVKVGKHPTSPTSRSAARRKTARPSAPWRSSS
jgi:elongation factor G